jgi:hypothetical protein
MSELLQCLERILRGQVIEKAPGLLGVAHRMVRLSAAEQLEHVVVSKTNGG